MLTREAYTAYVYCQNRSLKTNKNLSEVMVTIIRQHDQPTEPLPETLELNTLQTRAIQVFNDSEHARPTDAVREELLAGFSGTMGRIQAWNTVKDYALGKFDDVGEDFLRLIRAWLVLGDKEYSLVFKVTQLVKTALEAGLEKLDELLVALKKIFPRFSRRRLQAEIQAVKEAISFPITAV